MTSSNSLDALVPEAFRDMKDLPRDLPRLARDPSAMAMIEAAVCEVSTKHEVFLGDARYSDLSPDRSTWFSRPLLIGLSRNIADARAS